MKKLIHIAYDERGKLHCDEPSCGYVLPEAKVWGPELIGFKCPKCSSNMLTQKDFDSTEKMFKRIDWINKWFGWLGSEKPENFTSLKTVGVRYRNGELLVKEEE